jgi:hypothetical protein
MLLGIALCGIGFSSVYPSLLIVIAEIFGNERVASNYMVQANSSIRSPVY